MLAHPYTSNLLLNHISLHSLRPFYFLLFMLLFRISTDWLQHQLKSFSRVGKIEFEDLEADSKAKPRIWPVS